jgi:hypothetical protein
MFNFIFVILIDTTICARAEVESPDPSQFIGEGTALEPETVNAPKLLLKR